MTLGGHDLRILHGAPSVHILVGPDHDHNGELFSYLLAGVLDEFFDKGKTGMGMLASLCALPLAGPFVRPALKAAGTVAKPVVKAAGKTAGAVTKPLMKLRDPELRRNVLAGQAYVIDNCYAPTGA